MLQQEVEKSPAETLADAAVQLRRLAAWIGASSPCCFAVRGPQVTVLAAR